MQICHNAGCPVRVRLIKHRRSHLWYVDFPAASAKVMEFEKGKLIEWGVESRNKLSLERNSKGGIVNSVKVSNFVSSKIAGKEQLSNAREDIQYCFQKIERWVIL